MLHLYNLACVAGHVTELPYVIIIIIIINVKIFTDQYAAQSVLQKRQNKKLML